MLRNVLRYLWLALLFAALLAGCGIPQSAVNPTATPTSPATVLPQPTVTPAPATPTVPDLGWTRNQFGSAWNIAYPASWQVNTAGTHEGNLSMRGPYNGHTYEVVFSYPIFEQPVDTLDAWVEQVLAKLTPEQRQRVTVVDLTVAGAPAKKVLNVPGAAPGDIGHYVYIWRAGGQNPRLVVIRQRDDNPNSPVDLLASYYNAIDRQEYRRAYGYWQNPPGSYDAFVQGYQDTASVLLIVRPPTMIDVGAGNAYARIPTVLVARHTDGSTQTFAGCYTTHKINLQPPDVPQPDVWHITQATIAPVASGASIPALLAQGCQS